MEYFIINNKNGDIGKVKSGSKVKILFTFKDDPLLGEIEKLVPSCGCTSTKIVNNNQIEAIFDVGNIPYHLNVNYQPFKKRIAIHYKNDGLSKKVLEEIFFHGKRIKK